MKLTEFKPPCFLAILGHVLTENTPRYLLHVSLIDDKNIGTKVLLENGFPVDDVDLICREDWVLDNRKDFKNEAN